MYFGGTIILRGAASEIKEENLSSQELGEFFGFNSAVTLKFGQIPRNLVAVLSCPGVADTQTLLKSANMLQAIMYISVPLV